MRSLAVLLLLPAVALCQTADEKKATLQFIDSLRDPVTGAYAVTPPKEGEKPKPSLRAVNGAVNALKFFGGEVPDKEKVQKFVMGCYDEKTGAFAEPGEKPGVTITCIGVLAATAVGIDKAKYTKAMEYLGDNVKTFEDYRLGGAAIEAFGAEASGIDVPNWLRWAAIESNRVEPKAKPNARDAASYAALCLRLGQEWSAGERKAVLPVILGGQMKDGGWGKPDAKTSDAETTYRVMRALMLLKEKPKDPDGVAKFVASCRRKDGGYGVDATAPSSMSGVYYAAKISEWLK